MQGAELRDLKLTSKWRSYLIKAGFLTASEVLLTPPAVLAKRTTLPPTDISQLLLELATVVSCLPTNACNTVAEFGRRWDRTSGSLSGTSNRQQIDSAEKQRRTITLGDAGLDAIFGGGISIGSVTEIAGQSSSGKSHLCLQMALTAQLPASLGGVSGGTVFISSEGIMPSSRLLSLARQTVLSMPAGTEDRTPWDLMDNVHTEKAQDIETLESLLSFIAPAAIERINAAALAGKPLARPGPDTGSSTRSSVPRPPLPVRLVIVDSIAAPFRVSHAVDSRGFASRAQDLGAVGDLLKRLAHVYDCAVVVVNQISDAFIRSAIPPLQSLAAEAGRPDSHSTRSAAFSDPPHASLSASSSSTPFSQPRPAHEQHNLPALMYSRCQSRQFTGQSPSFPSVAALGHSWSNIVNTRVMLRRGKRRRVVGLEPVDGRDNASGSAVTGIVDQYGTVLVRHMTLVFSPYAERASVEYVIEESGVRSLGMPVGRESRWCGEPTAGSEAAKQPASDFDEEDGLWAAVGDGIDTGLWDAAEVGQAKLSQMPDVG